MGVSCVCGYCKNTLLEVVCCWLRIADRVVGSFLLEIPIPRRSSTESVRNIRADLLSNGTKEYWSFVLR